MVFQTRPGHLPGVVQVFRPDEAHHRVDQEGLEPLGKAIAAGLHGHLIGIVMGVGTQFGTLPGLKIHNVGAFGGALLQKQLPGLLQRGGTEAEGLVSLLAARNGLEDQVAGRPCPDSLHLGGDVGQDANLGGNLPVLLDFLKAAQHLAHLLRAVRHRIQADDRVSRAKAQALQCGSRDALRVVGGVVGLQTAGKGSRQADGGVTVGGDVNFIGSVDKVKVAHELAHRRHHFAGEPAAGLADIVPGGAFIQQPLPEFRHRPAANFAEDRLVHIVLNDPGDLVLLIGHGGVFPQIPQGHGRQHHLRRHPLLRRLRCQARQLVAGLFLVGLGKHFL